MLNRILILVIATGLFIVAWSSWQMYASTESVVIDKESTQTISENWNETDFTEGWHTESIRAAAKEAELAEEKTTELVEKTEEKEYGYEAGVQVGELIVPKLGSKYEVYWGTDANTLMQGVGYHVGKFTTPPDGMRHTVLSGHRDTVFQELGELVEGDRLYMEFEGKVYEYQIRKIWITDANDRTVIVDKDTPTLTLTTCHPFGYLGAAPERYIIQSELISVEEA